MADRQSINRAASDGQDLAAFIIARASTNVSLTKVRDDLQRLLQLNSYHVWTNEGLSKQSRLW